MLPQSDNCANAVSAKDEGSAQPVETSIAAKNTVPNVVRAHIELLHAQASGIEGKLIVASYGQDPKTNVDLVPKVGHFSIGDIEKTDHFVAAIANDQHRNVYMSLAVMRSHLPNSRKGTEQDIVAVLGLCADFDAKDDQHADCWHERLPTEPSFVLETSSQPRSSYQAFFLFTEPLTPEEAKPLAEALAEHCGCDHGTKDLSHVWRIPGLLNCPNAKKVAQGRPKKPQPVTVLRPFEGRLVTPSDLTPATQTKAGLNNAENGELPHVDIEILPVSDRIRHLIWKGTDSLNPERYPTRSEALFAVICAMVGAGCDERTIAAVCLDKNNAISAHIYDKQGESPKGYLARQVTRAQSKIFEPELSELNKKHAVIRDAGQTVVLNEEWDEVLGRGIINRSSFADFRRFYDNRRVAVGRDKKERPIQKPLGSWWLNHPKRRQYEGVTFSPGVDRPGLYNLWRGFSVTPKKGDWTLMREHLRLVICAGDEDTFEYVMGWMARSVQYPGVQGEVALVLRGKRGTGKSIAVRCFGSIFGQHFVHISNSRHLVGNFNAHLEDAVVVFADEAFWAGDKNGEGVLKMLITEPTIGVEAKYRNLRCAKNVAHIVIASNSDWVVPAGLDERRFCVLDVSEARMQDDKYFGKLVAQMDHGGREAMLHDLLDYDLNGYNVRAVPQTEALREQKIFSMEPHEKWYFQKLQNGQLLDEHDSWVDEVDCAALYDDYAATVGKAGVSRKSLETELGTKMRKLLPPPYPECIKRTKDVTIQGSDGNTHTEKRRVPCWRFPPLEECRAHFDKMTLSKHPWPKSEEENES